MEMLFHPDIAQEVKSSFFWYQDQARGLGDDFIEELESAYEAVREFPDTWPFFQHGFRRYILSRFPFSVIYREHEGAIYVVAVMHNSRRAGYWLTRLQETPK